MHPLLANDLTRVMFLNIRDVSRTNLAVGCKNRHTAPNTTGANGAGQAPKQIGARGVAEEDVVGGSSCAVTHKSVAGNPRDPVTHEVPEADSRHAKICHSTDARHLFRHGRVLVLLLNVLARIPSSTACPLCTIIGFRFDHVPRKSKTETVPHTVSFPTDHT